MRFLCLLLAVMSLFLWGCGYHLSGKGEVLPPDVHTIYIQMFANRTYEPFLENEITNAVTDEFISGRHLRPIDDPARADAMLSGEVTKYTTKPISYDRNDKILEYRSSMTVDAALRRRDNGRILWKGNVSWSEAYPANDNKTIQLDNEAAAIRVISARAAKELFFRIMDNF